MTRVPYQRFGRFVGRHRTAMVIVGLVCAFVLGYLVHSVSSTDRASEMAGPRPAQEEDADHAGHAGMGASSVPSGLRQLTISPQARALMDIETTRVERRYVTKVVRMVGKVAYDETRLKRITAWVPGRLDRLFVDFAGVEVAKGDHLVSIYSEELYVAQQELIQGVQVARDWPKTDGADLLQSSREKLRLLGLTPEQIEEIEKQDRPSQHLTIYSPISGTVVEKLRQEGDRVRLGERIYTVADLKEVWVKMDAYESDLVWVRYGQRVTFTAEAYPGERFTGRISFIDPVLDEATRTASVRVNVSNPDGKLKPQMFVHAEIRAQLATEGRVIDPALSDKWICKMHPEVVQDEAGECPICGMDLVTTESLGYAPDPSDQGEPVVIPASAPLITGTRAIVYVEDPDAPMPTYEGREIVLGPRAGGFQIVPHGLEPGEMVVTRGNFKIDSAVQIQAKPSMMTPGGGGGGGMHQHGGEQRERAETPEAPAMEIPLPFRKQIRALDQAYEAVGAAVGSGDLERARLAFRLLGASLDDVDADLLTGHPRMQWKELRMLLANDVFLGRSVEQEQDAQRIFESLTEHMQRLRQKLMMAPASGGGPERQSGK